jgi:hypothetical protein
MVYCVGVPLCVQAACGEGVNVHAPKGGVTGGRVARVPTAGGVQEPTRGLQAGEAEIGLVDPGMLQELGADQVRQWRPCPTALLATGDLLLWPWKWGN